MKLPWFFALAMAFSSVALANESGYIANGETHVVFRDGKKVGEWPWKDKNRKISSIATGGGDVTIKYDDDGAVRCYSTYMDNTGSPDQRAVALSCLKK